MREKFNIFMLGLLTGLVLFGIITTLFASRGLEQKCIDGAIDSAKQIAKDSGYEFFAMPDETIKWCKDNF